MIAAADYSVVNYSYCAGYMFVMGVGEGIQPLISYNYGKKDYKEIITMELHIVAPIGEILEQRICFINEKSGMYSFI